MYVPLCRYCSVWIVVYLFLCLYGYGGFVMNALFCMYCCVCIFVYAVLCGKKYVCKSLPCVKVSVCESFSV